MKKIVRLTESDITRIVKRVIREQATNIPASPQTKSKNRIVPTKQQKPSGTVETPSGFKFPFPLNLYNSDDKMFVTQVQVQSINFQGNEFVIQGKTKDGKDANYAVACDHNEIMPLFKSDFTNLVNDRFYKDFKMFYCTYSQYGKNSVPSAPGGYSSAQSSNKYTSMS